MVNSIYRFGQLCLFVLAVIFLTGNGSAMARECLDCHTDVVGQMRSMSHHVQGVKLTGRHCYACHWEATVEGKINKRYHNVGKPDKAAAAKQIKVDLVIRTSAERPTEYKQGKTAVVFAPSAIGTPSERAEVAKVSGHCLSCHNDTNNDTKPFEGDSNTPRQYAWDHQSVASRYSQKGVATWGKYSTATTNKKQQVTKAFSAHGNVNNNLGGWSSANGYDGDIPITRGGAGASNVECFDCHNSHGSTVAGVTSSYRTFDGTFNGGILKETFSGKGGYQMTYKPSINSYKNSKNPFNPGAGLCFDCHETPKSGSTPWGYSSTFGAVQPVMGYKDTMGFGPGSKGSTSRFTNRQSRGETASSHLKAGKPLDYGAQGQINGLCTPCHDPHGVSRTLGAKMPYAVPLLKGTWLTSPYREDGPPASLPAKGAQGPVRQGDFNSVNREAGANFGKGSSGAPKESDFNTVNRTAGANFGKGASGAPLEGDFNVINRESGANFGKGSSGAPKEGDFNTVNRTAGANFGKGASGAPREGDFNAVNREAGANFGKGSSEAPREDDFNSVTSMNRDASSNFAKSFSGTPREPMQGMKYNVDRNTFAGDSRIMENQDLFGGVCLNCHSRDKLAGESKTGQIHRAVKGWGNNKEHSFPCSKCHQAHNSGLPRLMQTNCFQEGPSGLRENSGLSWLPYKETDDKSQSQPSVEQAGTSSKKKIVGCHVRQFSKSNMGQEGNQWKDVTDW